MNTATPLSFAADLLRLHSRREAGATVRHYWHPRTGHLVLALPHDPQALARGATVADPEQVGAVTRTLLEML